MLRSAHLERAATQSPATILYNVSERYDFDSLLREGLDLSAQVRSGTVHHVPLPRRRLRDQRTTGPRQVAEDRPRSGLRDSSEFRPLPARTLSDCLLCDRKLGPVRLAPTVAPTHGAAVGRGASRESEHWCGCGSIYRLRVGSRAGWTALRSAPKQRPLCTHEPSAGNWSMPSSAPSRLSPHHAIASLGTGPRPVLFVGAFEPRKGFDLLLEAWPHVATMAPDARLLVIGRRTLAGLRSRLCELVHRGRVGGGPSACRDPPGTAAGFTGRAVVSTLCAMARTGRPADRRGSCARLSGTDDR